MGIVRSEVRKLLTIRTPLVLAGAVVMISVIATLGSAGSVARGQLHTLTSLRYLTGSAAAPEFLMLVLGILIVAGEIQHRSLAGTLLATPSRRLVLVAKALVAVLAGLVLGVLSCVVTLLTLSLRVSGGGTAITDHLGAVLGVSAGVVAGSALIAVMGLGFGATVGNQLLAVGAGLAWFLVLENLLQLLLPGLARWLPEAALTALGGGNPAFGSGQELLATVPGGLVALGYALALLGLGLVTFERRDVT